MAQITNQMFNIQDAFSHCYYVVPDYQREYVWTDREVRQLLSDIDEQFQSNGDRQYFIGTVLVSPGATANNFEIIDGQQRLTTFFLLLSAIRQRLKDFPVADNIRSLLVSSFTDMDGELRTQLKLDPQYENAAEIIAKLVEINGTPDTVATAVASSGLRAFGALENLLDAYKSAYRYLEENYPEPNDLKRYWGYVSNKVLFIQISTDISNALKIFETINERGVGLNPMDLVKNLLFKQVDKNAFTILQNEWKKITGLLEANNEKPLRFLRYFIMSSYKINNPRNDGIVREDEIYDWFTAPANAVACGYESDPFAFVRKLNRAAKDYVEFSASRSADGANSPALRRLQHLTGGGFSLHYVLLLAASRLPLRLFEHFVEQLESLLFYYIFTKTPTKTLERSFSVWADELRSVCDQNDPTQQKRVLNEFVKNRFARDIDAKSVELLDALNRYRFGTMQRYRTRYFLGRISQYTEAHFHHDWSINNLDSYMRAEIEHILPASPTDDLLQAWESENIGFPYREFSQKLGNLTPLEKTINIVAGNDFFEKKRFEYEKSGYYLTKSINHLSEVGHRTAVTRINESLKSFSEWNADSIIQRQQMLIRLAQKIWRTQEI